MNEAAAAQRLDKWLWHARFARTRGAAQDLILAGHVRVNRDKAKAASKLVRVGDVLTLALGRGVVVVRIAGLVERRVSAERAAELYAVERPMTDRGAPDREQVGSGKREDGLE